MCLFGGSANGGGGGGVGVEVLVLVVPFLEVLADVNFVAMT